MLSQSASSSGGGPPNPSSHSSLTQMGKGLAVAEAIKRVLLDGREWQEVLWGGEEFLGKPGEEEWAEMRQTVGFLEEAEREGTRMALVEQTQALRRLEQAHELERARLHTEMQMQLVEKEREGHGLKEQLLALRVEYVALGKSLAQSQAVTAVAVGSLRAQPPRAPSKGLERASFAPAAGGGAPANAASSSSSSPGYSLALFSFVAALLFVLLPAPSCTPPTRHSGGATSHGAVTGLKPLSYWSVDGEPELAAMPSPQPCFRLPPLTVKNTAYSMIALGGYAYHLSSLVTVHSIRRWDPDRAIVIHTTHKDLPPHDIVAAMTAMGARYNVVSEMDFENVGDPLYNKCGMFFGCWLKFFVWGMTEYAAVMNVDTDYIMLQNQGRAFDMFAKAVTSPYDVAGVPDLVVAMSHPDSNTSDVFNGGWFMAAPSEDAFRRLVKYASGPAPWKWGEMLTLNNFPAAHGGQWHRFPVHFNLFPMLINHRAPWFVYDGPNLGSILGLHFAGKSKVKPGATRADCSGYDGAGDSTTSCDLWVKEQDLTRQFLDKLTVDVDWGVQHHKLDPPSLQELEMPH